jgi:hypothetical protein
MECTGLPVLQNHLKGNEDESHKPTVPDATNAREPSHGVRGRVSSGVISADRGGIHANRSCAGKDQR